MGINKKAGKNYSMQDILIAQAHTRSGKAAARYLGCDYYTYRKFAQMYNNEETGKTLFDSHKNSSGKGIRKFFSTRWGNKSDFKIEDLIEGRVSIESYNVNNFKFKLLRECYLKEECYNCGFHERRLTDNKIPLLLNFKDGNKKNWRLDNLELKCYNCFFIYVGDIFTKKQTMHLEDYNTSLSKADTKEVRWDLDEDHLEKLKRLGL